MSDGRFDDLSSQTKRAVLTRLQAGHRVSAVRAIYSLTAADIVAIHKWGAQRQSEDHAAEVENEPRAPYIPTPDEIAAECEKFQAGWSRGERKRRVNGTVERVETHFIRVGAQRHAKHGGTL